MKMLFGAIFGSILFFAGKAALEDSDGWITYVGSLVIMVVGILSDIAVVLMLFGII